MKAAIYARVSTRDKGQDLKTQLLPLREYAQRRGLEIVEEYTDHGISGSKDRRPALDKLMKAARTREFDAVLVFKLDRFGRSLQHLTAALSEFKALGIEFVSITESIDTSTPAGKTLFGMIGVFAEFEHDLISERVRAGMARARRQGVKFGSRPRLVFDREAVRNMKERGATVREIAKKFKLSVGTVHRALSH
jgi:DNA invertase Pin-like site-specific DNA recombinase